jgi:CHAT domain-containing protein
LLHKSGKPVFVKMAKPEEVMEHKIGAFTVRQRLAGEPNRLNQLYKDTTELQAKIWPAALVKAIGRDKKVYFSPAGFQNRIAIEYMLPAQLDGADLYRLTSTRTLLYSKPLTDRQRALICGGISYEADINQSTLNAQHSSLNDLRAFDYAAGKHMKFTYLPGSLAEADTIKARRNMKCDLLLTGSDVTEQQFCELAPKYPIVNISTHGFFGAASTPMGTDLKPCLTDESMSENFLVLAGANTNIGDENFDKEQRDGLLSALEMSALDLSEVELFVASACQSGSGYITADGVYGIQRGLKNAGVGAMVVSLFNVSDKATSIMLSNFQAFIAQGMPLHKAFMAARETLKAPAQQKKVYFDAALMSTVVQGGDDFNLPQYTNAFILIDAVDF